MIILSYYQLFAGEIQAATQQLPVVIVAYMDPDPIEMMKSLQDL